MSYFNQISVLVTGAAGFIGSHLVHKLVEHNARVFALDCPTSDLWRLADVIDQITLLEADLTNYAALERTLRSITPYTVFHLAACTDHGLSFEVVDQVIRVNLLGTVNLLRALQDKDYTCLIYTGTAEEYGTQPAPFVETQYPQPISPYSAAKTAGWVFCDLFVRTLECPIITLRPFLVYGPGQGAEKFIPQLILSALRGEDFTMTRGEQTREFTYIDDLVDGYLRAATTPQAIGQVINLGTGQAYTLVEVARLVLELMDNPIKLLPGRLPYRTHEIWHYQCDNTRARTLLGWIPQTDLQSGLEKTIAWYREMKN